MPPTLTKSEWLKRCAAHFVEKAPWTIADANYLAQMCLSDHMDEPDTLDNYLPEDSADEEMSNWD